MMNSGGVMLGEFAARIAAGGSFSAVQDGAVWRAVVDGVPLVGMAGGMFAFSSAASAFDWCQAAVARRLAGKVKADGLARYVAKLEGLRLRAVAAGNDALARVLAGEIGAASSIDADGLLSNGGGAFMSLRGVRLDGGAI